MKPGPFDYVVPDTLDLLPKKLELPLTAAKLLALMERGAWSFGRNDRGYCLGFACRIPRVGEAGADSPP